MPGKRVKQPTHLAVVWWDDAWCHDEDGDEDKRAEPYPRVSFGALVQDDEKGVSLVDTYDPEPDTYSRRQFIPRAIVKRIRRFAIPWRREGR
jgi:hypothetical protein